MINGYQMLSHRLRRADTSCIKSNSRGTHFEDNCIAVCALHSNSQAAIIPSWLKDDIEEVVNLVSDSDNSQDSPSNPCTLKFFAHCMTCVLTSAQYEVIELSTDDEETPVAETQIGKPEGHVLVVPRSRRAKRRRVRSAMISNALNV